MVNSSMLFLHDTLQYFFWHKLVVWAAEVAAMSWQWVLGFVPGPDGHIPQTLPPVPAMMGPPRPIMGMMPSMGQTMTSMTPCGMRPCGPCGPLPAPCGPCGQAASGPAPCVPTCGPALCRPVMQQQQQPVMQPFLQPGVPASSTPTMRGCMPGGMPGAPMQQTCGGMPPPKQEIPLPPVPAPAPMRPGFHPKEPEHPPPGAEETECKPSEDEETVFEEDDTKTTYEVFSDTETTTLPDKTAPDDTAPVKTLKPQAKNMPSKGSRPKTKEEQSQSKKRKVDEIALHDKTDKTDKVDDYYDDDGWGKWPGRLRGWGWNDDNSESSKKVDDEDVERGHFIKNYFNHRNAHDTFEYQEENYSRKDNSYNSYEYDYGKGDYNKYWEWAWLKPFWQSRELQGTTVTAKWWKQWMLENKKKMSFGQSM